MMSRIKRYRFLIARRVLQFSLLLLFAAGAYWKWKVLTGDFSSALLLDTIHLSDPFAFLQILAAGFLSATDVIIGSLTILLIYSIIGGRVFCSWVCPVNWLTDTAKWLGNKLGINKSRKVSLPSNFRYWMLALSFILSAILGFAAFEIISPIGIMHRNIIFGFGTGLAVVAFIFLFELAVFKNGWCGHICPVGAFYAIIGKVGFLRIKHNVNKCTDCMDCFKVCPEPQVLDIVTKKSGVIKSSECTNCGRCVEICLDDALRFGNKYRKTKYEIN